MDSTTQAPCDNSFCDEKLPITEHDFLEQEEPPRFYGIPERYDRLTVQCFAVVIFMNLILYHFCTSSASSESTFFAYQSGGASNQSSDISSSAWEIAVSSAQTDYLSTALQDLIDVCRTLSAEGDGPYDCTIGTIASILLYSESLALLQEDLINWAIFPSSSGLSPDDDHWCCPFTSHSFPRLVPEPISSVLGTPIHHVGYQPYSSLYKNPIFSITTHAGIPLLFTFEPSLSAQPGSLTCGLRFGFGNTTTDMDPTSGYDVRLTLGDRWILDVETDYEQMQTDLSCLLYRSLDIAGIFFSARLSSSETASSGMVGTLSPRLAGEESEIVRMNDLHLPEKHMRTCADMVGQEALLKSMDFGVYVLVALVLSGLLWAWARRSGASEFEEGAIRL